MSLLSPWIVFVSSLCSAHICCNRFVRPHSRTIVFLSVMVVWVTLLIVPVELLAALQIAQVISRVTVPRVAVLELVVLAGCVILSVVSLPRAALSVKNSAVDGLEVGERLPPYLKLSAVILGGSYLLFAVDLCTSFPKGVDALSYHIPLALRWLQEGTLRVPADKAWQLSLPGNGEIVQMLALATGRQSLTALGSWISGVALAIAAYPLALGFSNGRKAPAFAAILVVFTIPMIEFQVFSAYVDLFGTAFLFAAVALFAHRYRAPLVSEPTTRSQSFSHAAVVVSALACGLSLGTKTTFLPYCVLFMGAAVYVLWKERRIHHQPVPRLLSVFLLAILLPSVFWPIRALQATGNPLYPTPVSVGSHVIFPGYQPQAKLLIDEPPGGSAKHGDQKFVRRPSEWLVYPWTEWLNSFGVFPTVYGEASGLGGAFASFVIVGVGFLAYQCAVGWQKVAAVARTALLAWLVLLLLWFFAMHRVLRFGLPIWVLACLLAVPAMAVLMKTCPRASAVLFVCAISTTCAVSSLVPFHSFVGNLLSRRWSRADAYGYPKFIDELPPGTCILNDTRLREKDFALAGNGLTNRVVTAFEAPQELTAEFLSSRKIDLVVQVTSANGRGDNASLAGLPQCVDGTEIFHSVLAGNLWRIWKVRSSPTPGDAGERCLIPGMRSRNTLPYISPIRPMSH